MMNNRLAIRELSSNPQVGFAANSILWRFPYVLIVFGVVGWGFACSTSSMRSPHDIDGIAAISALSAEESSELQQESRALDRGTFARESVEIESPPDVASPVESIHSQSMMEFQTSPSPSETLLRPPEPLPDVDQNAMAIIEQSIYSEITGLIIDDTMSPFGVQFYEHFYLGWETPPGVNVEYNIYIEEQATPQFGSIISVRVNQLLIFQQMVRPRGEDIENAARQALEIASHYLENYEAYQQQLSGEDLMGDGLY